MEIDNTEKLYIGRVYKVYLEDCCIEGGFTSMLTEIRVPIDEDWEEFKIVSCGDIDADDGMELRFSNGVYLKHWYGCIIEEV